MPSITDSVKTLLTKSKSIKQNLDLLDKGIDDLYTDTYMNTPEDHHDSIKIRNQIDKSISNLNKDKENSIGNMTKIYTRLALKKSMGDSSLLDSMNIFEDNVLMDNILGTWMQNKWISDLKLEIDTVLKYMPKLKEALECMKDCVLSADHFAKDFVTYHTIIDPEGEELFNERMEQIKKSYKIAQVVEQWYDQTSVYGEAFIYVAPYNEEFKKLLQDKNNNVYSTSSLSEVSLFENGKLNISYDKSNEKILSLVNQASEILSESGVKNLKITFDYGIIRSAATNLDKVRTIKENTRMSLSLKEQFEMSLNENVNGSIETNNHFKPPKNKISKGDKLDKSIPDDLKLPKDMDDNASEMIINPYKKDSDSIKVNVPGCIVKSLEPENVIPITIDDVCLGYYYFEFKDGFSFQDPNNFEYSASINTLGSRGQLVRGTDISKLSDRNNAINYIAGQLSEIIDAKFINANQDIRKELYLILKHNQIFNGQGNGMSELSNINITFIPAEDVTHIYFNLDPDTKRGITDLKYSLFPAKLYSSLYITDVLGRITRGQDKRVYYVKQNVETNISRTLLNVINQIKRGNFGARQMENLSNILNITGRFNDIVMPLSQGGDPPVTMDILPGQQFSDNSDLMEKLERMAINELVPYDLIESRQSLDYAIQATMSNSKLMRKVYKRQDIFQMYCSEILSKIYNYEFFDNENIEVELPAPSFLNMTNGEQLLNGTVQFIEAMINSEMPDANDDVKSEYRKLAMRYYLSSQINIGLSDKWKKRAEMNAKLKLKQPEE